MKFNRWILILFVIVGSLIYFSLPKQSQTPSKSTEDSLQITEKRRAKDIQFKTDEDSPLTDKATFIALSYYPYTAAWKLAFEIIRNEKVQRVSLQMTDGSVDSLLVFGTAQAEIEGKKINLLVYQHDSGDFFIPFKDKTAPKETYGGGRYLELPLTTLKDNQLIIDFNEAFFPYCAYNKTFVCPIPPKENQLEIRIPAGEKNP
ncbi:MAG: DUF1684 domain-containing protein [Bacteroidota bacterium]